MSPQRREHPSWAKGLRTLGGLLDRRCGRLDKTGEYATDGSGDEAVGKPGRAGVYTNQRLNLSKPWEGPRKKCQGFKPDPGNLAVRHYRGASRNVRHGETVNPPAIERAGPETPHLQRSALDLYPNRRHHSKPDPRLDPTRPTQTFPLNDEMTAQQICYASRIALYTKATPRTYAPTS